LGTFGRSIFAQPERGFLEIACGGQETPITLVTCGFGRAGRRSDRCESSCLKARVKPVPPIGGMRSEVRRLKSCAEWLRVRSRHFAS
jgi:hypothetical protein